MEVTPLQGGGQQESSREEEIEDESPIMFRHREIRSKKSKMRSMPLRIGSPVRDNPIPATTDGRPTVDQVSGQVTQAVVSMPDPMVTS
ncbi:hypothetical protein R1flu_011267 [Riccia fluitans]|uniref:Uncharacterized protein n=1 Tax=Riccia fluitans TaxID=41844 RepID=A0ABD1Z7B7_9MARC